MILFMDTKPERLKETLVEQLTEVRRRTRWLLSPVSYKNLVRQHDRVMSPLI